MANKHDLKIYPEYFDAVESGLKNFEIRKNDRDYQVEDMVVLREYDSIIGYTGCYLERVITYITDFEQKEGFVVFGMRTN